MKKALLAALAAPSLLLAMTFSPAASAQIHGRLGTGAQHEGPSYDGSAEGQLASAQRKEEFERIYGRGLGHRDDWNAWNRDRRESRRLERLSRAEARRLEAAPRGYRWYRYGDDYALVRLSNGRIVQVR